MPRKKTITDDKPVIISDIGVGSYVSQVNTVRYPIGRVERLVQEDGVWTAHVHWPLTQGTVAIALERLRSVVPAAWEIENLYIDETESTGLVSFDELKRQRLAARSDERRYIGRDISGRDVFVEPDSNMRLGDDVRPLEEVPAQRTDSMLDSLRKKRAADPSEPKKPARPPKPVDTKPINVSRFSELDIPDAEPDATNSKTTTSKKES
jgi:hypothetical protein